ncbi:double-strand break repair protein AddB [Sphingomonas bacterium]|uniref:double-strand break repair protein AddB n=1 Tax=Sphingomonas bacterium TaxID=1895847 RepID=UPI00157758ED|nr:double-strand break repair protein AddB [Sphingomonas bacterium]
MAEPRSPRIYTIPAHRSFADALVAGLMRGIDRADPTALARGLILLPNNRGVRAVTDAFVRASGGALLLPRLVALGDPDLGEAVGVALDPVDAPSPPLPAVAPFRRRMILARLIAEERARTGRSVDAGEAVRLAGELARTLDQLLVEDVPPARLRDIELGPELAVHWERSLDLFRVVLDRWPAELAALGRIDAAARRGALLDRLAERWRADPPQTFVCAAAITDTAPAVARLLRCVARLPRGQVVFAGLDTAMPDTEWDALGPHTPDPVTGRRRRSIETHPQYQGKLLLDRIGVARTEVRGWRGASDGPDAPPARARAIANALAPAEFTARWTDLRAEDRRLAGVSVAEFATPADEAQGIALALREALEVPGRTAALVTPDRGLANRVAAHLGRWGIAIDDSAGRPLALLPPGTLLLDIAEAAAQRFAPLALLALLKHPLVTGGGERLAWLDGVRWLDRALRGPRPSPGLAGVSAHLEDARAPEALRDWWRTAAALLVPVEAMAATGPQPLAPMIAVLRETADALCGDAIWSGVAGREASAFLADLEAEAPAGPYSAEPEGLAPLLRTLLDETAVRVQRGGPPRLAIYGLIEARLQAADLVVLGGLNEGTWPNAPAPDPWLAPRIRDVLGLPGLERRIGAAAHDFAQGLGAPQVMVTRARRSGTSPAIASRFWLRLAAMAGDRFERATMIEGWTRTLDDPPGHAPADRPAPVPPAASRPTAISVTEVDRLKADPYAFYARRVLRLMPLDPVDADPSAAWRGVAVHDILEQWWAKDACAVDKLADRARAMLADERTHPMMRALWQPRLMEAIDWIAARLTQDAQDGRSVLSAEGKGKIEIAGVTLSGRYDRIDRLADGGIGIVDYKTGKPPSATAVRAGFSLQLGLLGLIAERGGFPGIAGTAAAYEYWSLAKKKEAFGYVDSPVDPTGARDKIRTADFAGIAAANFVAAVGKWLTGSEPFTAKLVPEYAPYAEYDQLMRRDEWYGRER